MGAKSPPSCRLWPPFVCLCFQQESLAGRRKRLAGGLFRWAELKAGAILQGFCFSLEQLSLLLLVTLFLAACCASLVRIGGWWCARARVVYVCVPAIQSERKPIQNMPHEGQKAKPQPGLPKAVPCNIGRATEGGPQTSPKK